MILEPIGKHHSDALAPCGVVDMSVIHAVLSVAADSGGLWLRYVITVYLCLYSLAPSKGSFKRYDTAAYYQVGLFLSARLPEQFLISCWSM